MMKPVLFNTEMVRAILDGRKTVTRRLLKGDALSWLQTDTDGSVIGVYDQFEGNVRPVLDYAPYIAGDILYVRETWRVRNMGGDYASMNRWAEIEYKAGGETHTVDGVVGFDKWRKGALWIPSIHMPRNVARLFLRVNNVRIERVQDITEKGAIAEGIEQHDVMTINAGVKHEYYIPGTNYVCISSAGAFSHLWDSTIKPSDLGKYGWEVNPWVWVIEFECISMEDRTWI